MNKANGMSFRFEEDFIEATMSRIPMIVGQVQVFR
jgi:hypothetical protein